MQWEILFTSAKHSGQLLVVTGAEEEEQERIFHLQVNMFGHNAQHYVCWKQNTTFQPKHLIRSVKHGGGGLIIWASFFCSFSSVIEGMQQENDPKHGSNFSTEWLKKKRSLDLNLIEMPWRDLKRTVHKRMSWSNVEKQGGPEILHNKWKMITSGCCC